jgi:dinuclear metal center YbgI/SA1388 family protein
MKLTELVDYLDAYLSVQDTPDYPGAYNGLQVEGCDEIHRVAFAVDSSIRTVEDAVNQNVQMLLVHHGLFWTELRPFTGRSYRRIAPLIRHSVSFYSAHVPLDRHPEVGNNAGLMRMLGLEPGGSCIPYEGVDVGWWAETDISLQELTERVQGALGTATQVLATGPARVRCVGVASGGGSGEVASAHQAGLDTLITGEGRHHHYFDAEELGVNVLLAGHYATETVGVKLLAEHLTSQFGLETVFLDHPTGL